MNLFERADTQADHPSVEQLNAFVLGQLVDDDSIPIEQHLTTCPICSARMEKTPDDALVALFRQAHSLAAAGRFGPLAPADKYEFLGPGQRPDELGRLGSYRILQVLGAGGMGVVWKAHHEGLNRLVALKRLHTTGAASSEAMIRFRREAEAVARLHHPNIVQIYEIGERDGEPYLALEYVGGGSLAEKLAAGPLVPKQAAALVETLARAIHHAHEHGIIHRDLKPGNILLAGGGVTPPGGEEPGVHPLLAEFFPKISDFGLAKQLDATTAHTQTGAILGTPSYMAPEQTGSGQTAIGPATDVYALGAILYETLTGRPPFRGPTVLDTLAQVREREPVPPRQLQPTVPRDLQTICLKCLHKEPQRRYSTALELAEDLRRFSAGEPIRARPVGRGERLLKWLRRKPYQDILAGLVFLIPLAAIAGLLWHNDRLQHEIVRAETAEHNAQHNYEKSRQTILDMLFRINRWYRKDREKTADMIEALTQDGLSYIETVLDKGDNSDPQVRADAAELLHQIARIQVSYGRREEARANFTKSFHLWQQLNEEHPADARYCRGLAECYRIMSHFVPGDERQDVAWREKALKLHEETCRLTPDDDLFPPLNVAQCHHDLAAAHHFAQRLPEAEEHYNRSIELMLQLADKHPQESGCKHGLADSYGNLGLLYHTTGRTKMAEEAFGRAEALLETLMKEGRLVAPTVLSRSTVALNWGNLCREMGQMDKALACYDRGLAWCEDFLRQETGYASIRAHALKLHGSKANVYGALKRYAEAAAQWQRVVELAEGLDRWEYRLQRGITLARGGDVIHATAEADAITTERSCSPDMRYNCACIYALSGRAEKAVALLNKLRESGYFKDVDHLECLRTDTDLNSLRRRDDFAKLMNDTQK